MTRPASKSKSPPLPPLAIAQSPDAIKLDFAEPDQTRLWNRISKVTQAPPETVTAIMAGDASTVEQLDARGRSKVAELLTPESHSALERIIGPNIDFQDVVDLELARAAASSVARVVKALDGSPQGTGFMVSPGLFLTNNHVVVKDPESTKASVPDEARGLEIEFNFEEDENNALRPISRFALDPDLFMLSSASGEFDFALVAVGERISGPATLEQFGFCPLSAASDKHAELNFANIIQHPEGKPKKIAMRENRVNGRGEKGIALFYGADTLNGSSGSPVFNDEYELIALHHSGAPTLEKTFDNKDNDLVPVDQNNEGIRISALVEYLRARLDELDAPKRKLLEQALDAGFRGPSLMRWQDQTAPKTSLDRQESISNPQGAKAQVNPLMTPETAIPKPPETSAQPSPRIAATQNAQSIVLPTLRLTLPVELQIVPTTAGANLNLEFASELERRKRTTGADADFSNRTGYAPDFLGDDVPLPIPSRMLEARLARNKQPSPGKPEYVLDYQYFSLAMQGERRIAAFTAININDRDRFDVPRQNDVWSTDPRVELTEQTDESLYANNDLDRGHIVRRADTNWGPQELAVRANFDTFHYTNCSPQHAAFNQSERNGLWGMLENYVILKAAGERLSVLGGPILKENDPLYRGILLPREFWKILVRVNDAGQIAASAFVLSQEKLLAQVLERTSGSKSLTDEQARLSQRSIQELESLTDLDFGTIRQADTMRPSPHESLGGREVKQFSDLEL